MKKQFFSLLTSMCMLIGLLVPGAVFAADTTASSDVKTLLIEGFDYTLDSKLSAATNWSVDNESENGGSTAAIKADPENGSNTVLDVEVLSTQNTEKNKYARLSANVYTTEGSRENYISVSEKVRFTSDTGKFIFYVSGRERKSSDDKDQQKMNLTQFIFNLKDSKFSHVGKFNGSSSEEEKEIATVDIPLNKWIKMDFIFNATDMTYDVYMDDVKVNSTSLPMYEQRSERKVISVEQIITGANRYTAVTSGHMYVDDISIKAFNNLNTMLLPMAESRLAKMASNLTAYTLTGQKYVTADFTPNISDLQSDDTVKIACADSAFKYDASANKVTITQGTEDKIVDVTVTVTSLIGNSIEKILKVYIPSVSNKVVEENMNHSSKVGQSIVGTNNWQFDVTGEINQDGSTFKVEKSPDDDNDLMLDIHVVKQFSANNNPYVEWDNHFETDENPVIQANFMFPDDAKNTYVWYINGVLSKDEENPPKKSIVQLLFQRSTGKIEASANGATVTIAEEIPANQWFNVKLVLNSDELNYDVYIDNVRRNSSPISFATVIEGAKMIKIREMFFGANRNTYNDGHMYVDDIIIRNVKPAYEMTGLTFNGSNATLSVTKHTEEAVANAKAIVAVYDTTTGKLIKASTPVAVNSTGNVTIEGIELPESSKACAFIWKMDTLVPLAKMYE